MDGTSSITDLSYHTHPLSAGNVIGSYLMFYSKVYQYSTLGNAQVKHLKNIAESIVFHLYQT